MTTSNLSPKSAGAGMLAAIVASLCCITPLFSLLAGVGGIAATFSWIEPYRPYFIVLTIGVLGFAWYQNLKPTKTKEIDCDCEVEKRSFLQSKTFLGLVTLFATLMLALPSYSHIFYRTPSQHSASIIVSQDSTNIYKVKLGIKGMTCTGCENHISRTVNKLKGVTNTTASYADGNAIVTYNPKVVSKASIITAINATGYKVIEEQNQ